ncbi:MAG: hypothetical protein LBC81_06320 [Tannerellaceae bacterium]|jgi:hypothetical protein|nr:hypothetical protein [Tannerellaceae bacterium]
MNTNQTADPLKHIFKRLPEPELPQSFRENIMNRIMAEAERKKKRSEQMGWLFVAAASIGVIGLAAAAFLWFDRFSLSEFEFPSLNFPSMPFYIYIGGLALLLLGVDHVFVRAYRKRLKN